MRFPRCSAHTLALCAIYAATALTLLCAGWGVTAQAQQSRRVQYRQGWADFSGTDADNPAEIARFVELYRAAGRGDTITITSSASPEGAGRWLRPLAERRGEHLRRQLVEAGIPEEIIVFGRRDIDWPMLRDSVDADPCVPGRDEVLAIFETSLPAGDASAPVGAVSDRATVVLKQQIMQAGGGRSWPYLYRLYFPPMRYARAEFPGMKAPRHPSPEVVTVEEASICEPVPVADAPRCVPTFGNEPECSPFRYWALKTNMLHDLLLVPNIAVEWAFKPNWSIGADYSGAWWGNKYRTHLWRYYGGNLDLRYFFGRKAHEKPLQGWHVGVYGEFASYDFQFGLDGFQGKRAWGTGLTIGYMLPVSRHFNLDFTLGVGYFGGRYKRCRYMDRHEVWTGTYFRRWWGPTRGEISLTWLLGCGNFNKKYRR